MSRFPPIPPSEQTPEQEVLHKEMELATQKEFGSAFTLKNSDGAFLGPFAPLLYTPAIGAEWFHFNHTIMKTPIISLREREAAIFAVLSHSPAAYAIYAHKRLGEKVGFSPTQVASALGGHVPEGLSEREEATYILARELSLMRGPLSDASFEKASNVLGKDGAAAVIHTTGSFLHLTILLNAADVPVPE